METLQIAAGLVLIIIIFLDFFHTTLSGNGFGFLSGILNRTLNRIIIQNKARTIFNYSGMTHLLVNTFFWLAFLFLGAYIIYTAGEEMVIQESTLLPARYSDRFYFTSYVLSTVGIGDFVPGTMVSRVVTGILSFTGFVMVTTGLTYLLSVVSSVLSKKELSFYIATMGKDVEELYNFFKKEDNLSGLISDANNLRQEILKNASSYLAFPMVNYFLTKEREAALILQLAKLYEVLVVLKMDWEKDSVQYSKICTILNAIEKYLTLGLESPDEDLHNEDKLNTLRSSWGKFGYLYKKNTRIDKQFTSSLAYAGWNWDEVYTLKEHQ
ncbi:MAG: potassium channel family protein [Salinimicrobium sp.]